MRTNQPPRGSEAQRSEHRGIAIASFCAGRDAKIQQFWLALALTCAIGLTSAEDPHKVQLMTHGAAQLPIERKLPSIDGAIEWLNSPPLTTAGLRARVVLIDFWTYTCVNWRRTLPYVRAWAEKYKDRGLVVIGVHTPEFGIEKDAESVRRAAKVMRIDYPIAIDSDFRIWRALNNQYWPALYFVDAQGQIRHHQFGEGEYEQSELIIQQLLAEAGSGAITHDLTAVEPDGFELAADWSDLRSAESYIGYERAENFSSPGDVVSGKRHLYAVPARLGLNDWALSGDWTSGREAAVLNATQGRIAYRFHARDLNLIMGPTAPGASVRFRVLIDGQPPGAAHGVDVDGQGNGTVSESRLYQSASRTSDGAPECGSCGKDRLRRVGSRPRIHARHSNRRSARRWNVQSTRGHANDAIAPVNLSRRVNRRLETTQCHRKLTVSAAAFLALRP